ncbi:white collar 2 type of transcription factor [Flagelloscypha sp. PMI_526]|nr:white collar 2 type of transcription factor [Flagelloscypha sp. PMI_526]
MPSEFVPYRPSFDFPKSRKKWAEILITELAGVVAIVLDAHLKPLFCSTSSTELLGWKDSEIIGMQSLRQLVHEHDAQCFMSTLQHTMRTRGEFVTYARLKTRPPPTQPLDPLTYPAQNTVLTAAGKDSLCFELKGYPYFSNPVGPSTPNCLLLMATPFPSKSDSMLDSFLDLKLENERLKQHASDLRSRLGPRAPTLASTGPSRRTTGASLSMQTPSLSHRHQPYPSAHSSTYQDYSQSTLTPYTPSSVASLSGPDKHQAEDPSTAAAKRRKRRKLAAAEEQHVCSACGRTDSPEWRKGPMGPKTLCNACGLRYAKTQKQNKEGS